jgi:RNA polymerase sigma-70 factor (ECF subfamily)
MGSAIMSDNSEIESLLRRAAAGEEQATRALSDRFQERLQKMIRLRMDARLKGRVDSDDILQETWIEACRRLPDYVADPPMSFYLWLRSLAVQKLTDAMRQHLGVQKRDAGRDVSLHRGGLPEATSVSLAAQLLGRLTSPSNAAIRAETQIKVQEVLNEMDPIDREVLVLRHFEYLSNAETAELLGIKKSAASKRYLQAIRRLKAVLRNTPGFEDRF